VNNAGIRRDVRRRRVEPRGELLHVGQSGMVEEDRHSGGQAANGQFLPDRGHRHGATSGSARGTEGRVGLNVTLLVARAV